MMGSKLLRNPVGEHNYKRIFNGLRPVFLNCRYQGVTLIDPKAERALGWAQNWAQ